MTGAAQNKLKEMKIQQQFAPNPNALRTIEYPTSGFK